MTQAYLEGALLSSPSSCPVHKPMEPLPETEDSGGSCSQFRSPSCSFECHSVLFLLKMQTLS